MIRLLPALLLPACRAVQAPETLEELVVYGFVHHQDDADYLEATAEELLPRADRNFEDLADGYAVDSLTQEDLEAAGVDAADTTDVVGALGAVDYRHDIDEILAILTRGDKEDLYEDMPVYDLLETTDIDCFLSRACETLEQRVHESIDVALLGTSTRTYTIQYRWIQPEGSDPLVFIRSLCPDGVSFNTNIVNVFQQYALVVLYPKDGHARRLESFWVDAEFIGMDTPESTAVNMAVNQMASQAEQVDALIDELSD